MNNQFNFLYLVGPKQRLFSGVVIQYSFAIGELILLAFAYAFRTWRLLHIALAILSLPFLLFYLYEKKITFVDFINLSSSSSILVYYRKVHGG